MGKAHKGKLVLATDLGGTNMRTALLNDKGEILTQLRKPTNANNGKDKVIKQLITMLKATASKSNMPLKRIDGIGIGFPGPVDVDHGLVLNPPNMPGWIHVPLRDIMEKEFKKPVTVENDANAAALGEYWLGAGKGVRSLVCLTLGTGVGGGIVINDRVWHGAAGIAGEIGHTIVVRNGHKCGCGNLGCLEAYASATGMVRLMHKALKQKSKVQAMSGKIESDVVAVDIEKLDKYSSRYISELAASGNKIAQGVINEMIQTLGIAIANIVHILNPEVVVICGGIIRMGPKLFKPLREEIKDRAFKEAVENLRVVPAKLGGNAGIVGAARSSLIQLHA